MSNSSLVKGDVAFQMRTMDKQKRTAKKYLETLSIGDVIFEPYGNVPPDFSVGSAIGVEVRRLNENYFGPNETKGLEEVDVPLHQKLREILISFDSRYEGRSFWVAIDFRRPLLGGIKGTGEDIRKTLDGFLKNSMTVPCELRINTSITLQIIPKSPVPNRLFRYGASVDDDSGGSDVELYSKNISHCIQVKSQKITLHKPRYDKWWLVLVDTMMFWDMEADEVDQVRSGILNMGSFDKLVVIDYLGDKCLFKMP